MMPKRVFFSHSTKDGTPERVALETLVQTIKADGYEIQLDYKASQAGKKWRERIDSYIKDCHAAVILVTPGSIASNYCSYEWSALSFRSRIQKQFPIFPVFFGSKPDDIKGRADQIYELEGYFGFAGIETIIPNLKQRLLVEIDETCEPRFQVLLIADALRDVVKDDALIEAAARNNQIDLGGFALDAGQHLRFARKIMDLGLVESLGALQDLRQIFVDKAKTDAFRTMVDLVGRCSWVKVSSSQRLRVCARSDTARVPLGLNADNQRTAEAYILAASDRHPDESWPFGAVLDAYGAAENDFHTLVRAALIEALGFEEGDPGDAAIKSRLRVKRKGKLPVFVLLKAGGLKRAWIERLCANELFAGVTFLILTGQAGTPGLLADDGVLQPVLPEGFEDEIWGDYDTVVKHELKLA